jgi:hypothetical protein
MPKTEENKKCTQAVVKWKYFSDSGDRIDLESTLNTLIEEGYNIDLVVPITSYKKEIGTVIGVTEALIIVSM